MASAARGHERLLDQAVVDDDFPAAGAAVDLGADLRAGVDQALQGVVIDGFQHGQDCEDSVCLVSCIC